MTPEWGREAAGRIEPRHLRGNPYFSCLPVANTHANPANDNVPGVLSGFSARTCNRVTLLSRACPTLSAYQRAVSLCGKEAERASTR